MIDAVADPKKPKTTKTPTEPPKAQAEKKEKARASTASVVNAATLKIVDKQVGEQLAKHGVCRSAFAPVLPSPSSTQSLLDFLNSDAQLQKSGVSHPHSLI